MPEFCSLVKMILAYFLSQRFREFSIVFISQNIPPHADIVKIASSTIGPPINPVNVVRNICIPKKLPIDASMIYPPRLLEVIKESPVAVAIMTPPAPADATPAIESSFEMGSRMRLVSQ